MTFLTRTPRAIRIGLWIDERLIWSTPEVTMAIPIPRPLVEFILLGPLDDRRQVQDSPILGDVWVEYGKNPNKALDLLIEPYRGQHAGAVAAAIDDGLGRRKRKRKSRTCRASSRHD